MARPEARVQALGALYAADVLSLSAIEEEGLSGRARGLATGTWAHREEIDSSIDAASDRWRVERMPAVDRSILRLATFELQHTQTPRGVVISEAVELAKSYSTARSGAFVNGVLSAIAGSESESTRV
ncbi:MAG: transcription antitermination factor NusB [Acidimicrobiia bacterium]|nr:transcription antitermination factor NusB [Acidimicrobiia bacterium]